jgi:hypothetical protein
MVCKFRQLRSLLAWLVAGGLGMSILRGESWLFPAEAIGEFGALNQAQLKARWRPLALIDGYYPTDEGYYVTYHHVNLILFFGPLRTAREQVQFGRQLQTIREAAIAQLPELSASRVGALHIDLSRMQAGSGKIIDLPAGGYVPPIDGVGTTGAIPPTNAQGQPLSGIQSPGTPGSPSGSASGTGSSGKGPGAAGAGSSSESGATVGDAAGSGGGLRGSPTSLSSGPLGTGSPSVGSIVTSGTAARAAGATSPGSPGASGASSGSAGSGALGAGSIGGAGAGMSGTSPSGVAASGGTAGASGSPSTSHSPLGSGITGTPGVAAPPRGSGSGAVSGRSIPGSPGDAGHYAGRHPQ